MTLRNSDMHPEELSVTVINQKNFLPLHNCSACNYCLFNMCFMTTHRLSKDQRPQYSGINIILFITWKVGGNPCARPVGWKQSM